MAVQGTSDTIDNSQIKSLVQQYQDLSDYERRQKNEAEVRQQFINPLLRALGWDTTTDQVKPEQRTLTGHADYALSLNGQEQFFIEAKKFVEDLDGERRIDSNTTQSYVEQAIDYAWHQRCDWAVLTNFEELRLYWTHVNKDNPEYGLVYQLSVDDFVTDDGFDKLTDLSKKAVENGSLEQLERTRQRDSVTAEVLNTLSKARIKLTRDINNNEPKLELDDLREGVQRILDRLVVMRVAEDRGVIASDILLQMMQAWESTTINPETRRLVRDLSNAFRDFDSVYNSALFAEHPCEDYDISNEPLKEIIESLYEYNFKFIDADILGTIYEDYLGHAIEDKAEGLELADRADERREDGVYYTPVPVVEYIVDSTLGDRLDSLMEEVRTELNRDDPDFEAARESFDKIEDVRFLDVSCGSGSFLIKAYDKFVECYEEYQSLARDARPSEKGLRGFSAAQTIPQDYRQQILKNNLFGLDLDRQATEIASVNLFLKALQQGEKLPTILEENIRQGNSLLNGSAKQVAEVLNISKDEARELGAFDWKTEFDNIFNRNGNGFTVIAGNPPWGAEIETYKDWVDHYDNYQLADGQYDSYELFLELTADLLEDGGTLGFIIPDSILREEHEHTRKWLAENHQLDQVHKLGEGVFEDVWAGSAILQYTTTESDGENIVECSVLRKEDRDRMEGAGGNALNSLIQNRLNTKRQQRILDEDDYNFRVFADETDYEIMDIMETDTVDTKEVLFDSRGDEIGKSGEVMRCPNCMEWDTYPRKRAASKGGGYYPKTCTHCEHGYEFENAVETRTIIKEVDPGGNEWKKLYFGEHVTRYRETGHAYIDDTISGIDFEDESLYEPPKILLRKTGFGFNAMLDYSDARGLQVVFIFRLKDERDSPYDKYDLEYFLGLLNSRIMLYYYTKERSEIEWQSYPYKTQGLVMGLPFPEIDWDSDEEVEKYNRFVELVREASQNDGEIDPDTDWEIERLAYDFYGIPTKKRNRVTDELHELQRLQVVRELFPDAGDEE
jgi:type I restriction-modification system DNA methylase subunit